ncbi:TetR/AcrR family transcriptional regulator [Nocardia pseudovaccinii]|uniref:TetR/AcrR family transcriptional regulator n=1 Tax=Nocardia pseudovaccinii TaxID=189540 RepID=UPI003D8E436C
MATGGHSGRRPDAGRRRPRDRRATILRVATEAFVRNGYHGTSMADIAGEVGISSTALYRHFRSKQDLLGRCLLAGLDAVLLRVETAAQVGDAGDPVFAEMVSACLELRGLPRLWQLEVRSLTAADRSAVLVRAVRLSGPLRRAVAARRPDLNPPEVEFLAWCVFSIATSPSYHRIRLSEAVFAELLETLIQRVVEAELASTARRSVAQRGARTAGAEVEELDRVVRPERIVRAAARLFNTYGYAAVGIEDIGAAVGVSGPALYHHFSGKADVLNEIVHRNDQWIKLYTSRAVAEADSPRDALQRLMRYFAQFAVAEPDVLGTTFSEAEHLPPEQARRYLRAHRDGIVRWARMLQVVRPDLPLDVARAQIQAMTSMIIDAVRNPRLTWRPDLVTRLAELGDRVVFAAPDIDRHSTTA